MHQPIRNNLRWEGDEYFFYWHAVKVDRTGKVRNSWGCHIEVIKKNYVVWSTDLSQNHIYLAHYHNTDTSINIELSQSTYVDYNIRWGIHEAFFHNSPGNDVNVTRFGQLGHRKVPHL